MKKNTKTKMREKLMPCTLIFHKNSIKGITLVALVVTIVVLLILAGVTLNLLIGDNGIIKKAKEAKVATEQAAINDQIAMNSLYDELVGLETGTGGGETGGGSEGTIGKVAVGTKASKNSTINGEEPSATNPIIPEGYTPIDTDTTSWGDGTTVPTEEDVNKGLVITDDSSNEWVWVPIATPNNLYVTVTEPINITGGVGKNVVSGVQVSNYSKSAIISGETRVEPNNTSSWREPDIVVGNGAEYDAIEANWRAAGFTSLKDMAENLTSDYSDMINSLEQYKGFYIGRYELSEAGVQKDQPTLTQNDWYNLYKKCKTLNGSNKVTTRMIWGCQWDATCDWISKKGDIKNITDSRGWGNYIDSQSPANEGNYESNQLKNTGSNEAWKANNIYDLAGNCYEWTQDAYCPGNRGGRGGLYNKSGLENPVSYRNSYNPTGGEDSGRRLSCNYVC